MVQILVKINGEPSNQKEWAILELQGHIETNSGDSIEGQFIGHLIYSKVRPILVIGCNILYGKVIESDPYVAVLKKRRPTNVESETSTDKKAVRTEYTVLALVKKKLVFKTRPKPVVFQHH
ncbi:chromosome transmission fidelity protein 8 homolog [Uloborus diversus]|uniref:chromosome transmission fidelity protein 8 homolog n=1 Tax=Uloborus diversus TaxID=327109 RepID=UPI002409C9A5|nr:chromosome transmission fidelity protein 8 homolog [Uloborus diversus]